MMILTGCNGQSDEKNTETNSEPKEKTSVSESGDISEDENIQVSVPSQHSSDDKITFVTIDSAAMRSDKIINELNEKLHENGVEKDVEFIGFSPFDYEESVEQWLSEGNKADIMFSGYSSQDNPLQTYKKFVDNNKFVCLDDYFDTDCGKKLKSTYTENYWDSLKIDGKIYGISYYDEMGYDTYQVVNEEKCKEFGFDSDTFSGDWSEFNNENMKKASLVLSDVSDVIAYEDYYSFLDGELFGIKIIEDKSGYKAVNIFEEYKDDYKQIEDLIKKGIANQTETENMILRTTGGGYNFSEYVSPNPNAPTILTKSKIIKKAQARQSGCATGIISDSSNKEDAFKVLALINSDEETANILKYGLKDENYKEEDGVVIQKDDEIPLLCEANNLICKPFAAENEPADKYKKMTEYNENMDKNKFIDFRADFSGIDVKKLSAAYSEICNDFSEDISIDLNQETSENTTFKFSADDAVLKLKNAGMDEALKKINEQLEIYNGTDIE